MGFLRVSAGARRTSRSYDRGEREPEGREDEAVLPRPPGRHGGGVLQPCGAVPLAVQPSSYEQKIAAAAALGLQVLPPEVQGGNAVALADFFQDGGWSMVTHSLEYDARDAGTPAAWAMCASTASKPASGWTAPAG